MSFRYILRYYIDPGFHEDDRIKELVEFWKTSSIGEVMLFHNPEECYQGFTDENERSAWLATAKKIKSSLTEIGVELSVNPWSTLVHRSRGRVLAERLAKMTKLVGETGEVATLTACPYDQIWREELSTWFARIAAELQPTVIWVEDDWRLHNFGDEFGFGGCFCETHLKRAAEILNIPSINREELLARIRVNDLDARRAWMFAGNESLMGAAGFLYQAVRKAYPQARLGLMRSSPDTHSIEGASWYEFKEKFSPDTPLAVRPHLPPYTENYAMLCLPEIARQTVSELDAGMLESFPEMESSPRCGKYSKSCTMVAWECLSAPLYGSKGITINHYDMMGNGIILDKSLGKKLHAIKPRLDAVTDLGCNEANALGVNILYLPDAASKIPVKPETASLGLRNNSISWAYTLGILGISHKLVRWERFSSEQWNAISGATIAAMNDDEIRRLLTSKLLLDAESIMILYQRGFGEDVGVSSAEFCMLKDAGYAWEEIQESDPAIYGLSYPRVSAQRCDDEKILKFACDGRQLSTVMRYDKTPYSPGLTLAKGKYLLSPWIMTGDSFFMGYFNRFRRILLQRALAMVDNTPAAFSGEHPAAVYWNRLDGYSLLTVNNLCADPMDEITFTLHGAEFSSLEILDDDGKWIAADFCRNNNSVTVNKQIMPLEYCFIKVK